MIIFIILHLIIIISTNMQQMIPFIETINQYEKESDKQKLMAEPSKSIGHLTHSDRDGLDVQKLSNAKSAQRFIKKAIIAYTESIQDISGNINKSKNGWMGTGFENIADDLFK